MTDTAWPHVHEQGLHVQPLPACLAATDAERATLTGLRVPRAGEQVVLHGEHVYWLVALRPARPHSFASTRLWSVPINPGARCAGAGWGQDQPTAPDPADPWHTPESRAELWCAASTLLDYANTTRTGTCFPAASTVPSTSPVRVDARMAAWTLATLQDAAGRLEAADDLAGELERSARTVADEQAITDPELIRQIVHACHAAIALVFLTEYRRAVVLDPATASDPATTATAVQALYTDHPPVMRPYLALQAAMKVEVWSAAF
jgi:hypothetical protein